MWRRHNRNGFSLIELLTVIAIIAILAAIIFPVMNSVKKEAKMVNCMTNLHGIAMALKMYQQDNRKYPETLAGYVQTGPSGVIPLEQTKGDALYPEYIKKVSGFHCPMAQITDTKQVVKVEVGGQTYEYYAYDSYNIFTPEPSTTSVGIEGIRYTLTWAGNEQAVSSLPPPPNVQDTPELQAYDYKRQLRFRSPSEDAVVTWCSYHRHAGDERSMVPVLFLDGHCDKIPATQIEGPNGATGCRWRIQAKKG